MCALPPFIFLLFTNMSINISISLYECKWQVTAIHGWKMDSTPGSKSNSPDMKICITKKLISRTSGFPVLKTDGREEENGLPGLVPMLPGPLPPQHSVGDAPFKAD